MLIDTTAVEVYATWLLQVAAMLTRWAAKGAEKALRGGEVAGADWLLRNATAILEVAAAALTGAQHINCHTRSKCSGAATLLQQWFP